MFTFIKVSFTAIVFCLLVSPLSSQAYTHSSSSTDQKTADQSVFVNLMANGSGKDLSFSGKKRVKFTWTTAGVENCHLYVARGNSYKASNNSKKTIAVNSAAPYVQLSCNNKKTGVEVSDTINISDPKGVVNLSVSTDSFTVSAVTTIRLPKQICGGSKLGTINWGDGSSDQVVAEQSDGKCALEASDTQTHTYNKAGDYNVTFKSISGLSKKVKVEIGA